MYKLKTSTGYYKAFNDFVPKQDFSILPYTEVPYTEDFIEDFCKITENEMKMKCFLYLKQ